MLSGSSKCQGRDLKYLSTCSTCACCVSGSRLVSETHERRRPLCILHEARAGMLLLEFNARAADWTQTLAYCVRDVVSLRAAIGSIVYRVHEGSFADTTHG